MAAELFPTTTLSSSSSSSASIQRYQQQNRANNNSSGRSWQGLFPTIRERSVRRLTPDLCRLWPVWS